MSPFQGCRDRIKRGIAHRETLAQLWNNLVNEDLYDISVDVKYDGTGTICVSPSSDLPRVFALEIGEALYHFRAALDGCVYQAAIIESGQDPPPGENRLEFPICSSADNFRNSAGKIEPLADKCRNFIESIQPYHTPELRPDLYISNVNRTLGILNDWARKDRHRQLHVVGSWVSNPSPKMRIPTGTSLRFIEICGDGFLEHKREIARFKIDGFIPGMKVQANPGLMIDIALDEVPQPCADNDTLGDRLKHMSIAVSFVVNVFEHIYLGKSYHVDPGDVR